MNKLPRVKLNNKPTYLKFAEGLDLFGLFQKIEQEFENCFIFESLGEQGHLSRYSIIGFDPKHIITTNGKDFIFDTYQIYESFLSGADCVLLIASILSESRLKKFLGLSAKLGLDALVEVQSIEDARKALRVKAGLVGINNRDLKTFRVDLARTKLLAPYFKNDVLLISESGIQSAKDLIYLKRCGAQAVLIGESLMRQKNPGRALSKLIMAGTRG